MSVCVFAGWAGSATALPMSTDDDSSPGDVYNLVFVDGFLGDLYSGVQINAAAEAPLPPVAGLSRSFVAEAKMAGSRGTMGFVAGPQQWRMMSSASVQATADENAVPAPASLALIGLALVGLGLNRRKRALRS
jgi:hypothetical protein